MPAEGEAGKYSEQETEKIRFQKRASSKSSDSFLQLSPKA
jgi:hypothetical protein